MALASSLDQVQRAFLQQSLERLSHDPRLVGILAAGSYLTDTLDEFSDLDLVLVADAEHYPSLVADREELAASLGHLLVAFSGEHVGEPRLLICLYDAPLLHVDLKLVALADLAERVEEPAVLWERDGRVSAALREGVAQFPEPDARWLERRFWVWVHYAATKIGRGELFEALHLLDYLRSSVLGPLGLLGVGARPSGVRRVETAAPELALRLRDTVARYDRADCLRALGACVQVYRWLRPTGSPDTAAAEARVVRYLAELHGLVSAELSAPSSRRLP